MIPEDYLNLSLFISKAHSMKVNDTLSSNERKIHSEILSINYTKKEKEKKSKSINYTKKEKEKKSKSIIKSFALHANAKQLL